MYTGVSNELYLKIKYHDSQVEHYCMLVSNLQILYMFGKT